MTRKIVYEIKLPKAATIALYAIAIALVLKVTEGNILTDTNHRWA